MVSRPILSCASAQSLDEYLIHSKGFEAYELMRRAGESAFHQLMHFWPHCSTIAVFCGGGNNGGDGYVLAAAALREGVSVKLYCLAEPKSTESRQAFKSFLKHGGLTSQLSEFPNLSRFDVVVDALLGIGISRDVTGELAQLIENINTYDVPVLSLDIPSGLDADTGYVKGIAIQANATVTFISHKLGLMTGQAYDYVGSLVLETLNTEQYAKEIVKFAPQLVTVSELTTKVPHRKPDAHKVSVGQVLIVGGNSTMQGAASMAALAAYRSGAGLVSIATTSESVPFLTHTTPEIRLFDVSDRRTLLQRLKQSDVVGIGPGLGQDDWASKVWGITSTNDCKLVVDADALNLLAQKPMFRDDWILTPHPGEAARLLAVTSKEIQKNRFESAQEIAVRYGGVCVLKGVGTLIVSKRESWLCNKGNPGMATGGMGDVLTGVICALVGQGMKPDEAARAGVWIHANAGDRAAEGAGMLGTMATDLLPYLRLGINQLHPQTKGVFQQLTSSL